MKTSYAEECGMGEVLIYKYKNTFINTNIFVIVISLVKKWCGATADCNIRSMQFA